MTEIQPDFAVIAIPLCKANSLNGLAANPVKSEYQLAMRMEYPNDNLNQPLTEVYS